MQRSALSQGLTHPAPSPRPQHIAAHNIHLGALHPQGPLTRGKDGKEGLPESCDTRPRWAQTRHLATESTLPGTQIRLCSGLSDLKQPLAAAERCRLYAILGKVLTLGVGPSATSEGPLMKADHEVISLGGDKIGALGSTGNTYFSLQVEVGSSWCLLY